MVDCWEECLLGRHLRPDFELFVYVLQIGVSGAHRTHYEPGVRLIDVDDGDHGAECVPVGASATPLEADLLRVDGVVKLVIRVLKQDLMTSGQLQLLNLQ